MRENWLGRLSRQARSSELRRNLAFTAARIGDAGLAPLTVVSSAWLRLIRTVGLHRMPVSRRVLMSVGVLPIRNHYYEPLFDARTLRHPLSRPRSLPGIDFNDAGQIELLRSFRYADELTALPRASTGRHEFFYDNPAFKSGDAEYLYNIIRRFKPHRMIEIGSGFSTLMARRAIEKNGQEDTGYQCRHVCIEPYEQPCLEAIGVDVVRKTVEEIDLSVFDELEANDILFIDSSHVIRPQGDVVVEISSILPRLKKGVLVHVHDIFTPRDYPHEWVSGEVRLWNEQYMLEAFLAFNSAYRVLGALNYLKHTYPGELGAACPVLASEMDGREPGSFWMQRI